MSTTVNGRTTTSTVRVRYAETDKMGVVYYAHYLVWFEIARTDWLRDTGWSYRAMEDEGLALPVIEAQCSYRQSAKYDDEMEVRTRAKVTAARIQFDYEIVRRADGAAIATGHTVHATIDRRGRPVRIPERVRGLFA